MKKIHRYTAILLSILMITMLFGCHKNTPPEISEPSPAESSQEESSEEESSQEESSKEESSKEESSKEESSEPELTGNYSGPDTMNNPREIYANLQDYYASNHDTVGWVAVPNTLINYVVLKSPKDITNAAYNEDPYYLTRDFYGNYYFNGSIFMDFRSDISSKNMLLHGHSMADGSMFAGVLNFDNLDFYKYAPTVSFNTLKENAKWKIIAVIKVNTNEYHGTPYYYLRSSFGSDYDFLNYVYEIRQRSVIDCPVTVNENDTLVTLSTCAYDFDGFRQVIIARKVRPGESTEVKVGKAKYNPNPLYPDVWYSYYGGTKPVTTSFQDALNKKQITWYDGTKKWGSKDDEALQKLIQDYKNNAEKRIRASYKESDYTKEQVAKINEIIDIYMPVIKQENIIARINDFVNQCIAVLDLFEPVR
ncbi:MAG: class B sortase [Clostridia bacterium]|nr:class B sortase [Clostridia bacterium]